MTDNKTRLSLDEMKNMLCKGNYSSFSISWNSANSMNYCTVAEAIACSSDLYEIEDFISPEEYQKCIDQNSIWSAQWYPDTPVGCCVIHASTYEALHAFLENECNQTDT